MSAPLLPAAFAELEVFVDDWALPTERERYARRLGSSMDQMRVFYDAVMVRVEEARKYLDSIALDEMPEEAQRLMWLLFSFITVAYPIEIWGQPKVPDTGAAYIDRVSEPATFPV